MKVFVSGFWIDHSAIAELRKFRPINGIMEMDHLPKTPEEIEEAQSHMAVFIESVYDTHNSQIATWLTNMVIVEQ